MFDVGETLVNETRHLQRIADRLGVPRFTFIAVLGGVVQQNRDHRDAFTYFDVDLGALHPEKPSDGTRSEAELGPVGV